MFTITKCANDITIYDRHMLAISACHPNKSYTNAIGQYATRRTTAQPPLYLLFYKSY